MTSLRPTRPISKVDNLARRATPISIRASIPLAPGFADRIRTQLANRVGHEAHAIERATVRFEDANGPKGGACLEIDLPLAARQAEGKMLS